MWAFHLLVVLFTCVFIFFCFFRSTGGSLKLSFEPSLTIDQVESENEEVVEGQYNPSDCTARQSVAILIPHRNREKHLLYLLYHLHPFLQRQQLHYAIYVIHQVGKTPISFGSS